MREIKRLSQAAPVNMTDHWHEIASLDHFWIRRRFEVLCALLDRIGAPRWPAADIGCGRGLLQSQLETRFGQGVDGFDLDEFALQGNVSRVSNVYLYNIHDCAQDLGQAYGSIFLFDVLEHVEDQQGFLRSVLHHLRPGGRLYVNLPSYRHLYSRYDVMAGHLRRYTLEEVEAEGRKAGLRQVCASYWGAPYYPLLLVRKLLLAGVKTEKEIVARGFEVKRSLVNTLLGLSGRLERIPQRAFGTSVMAVFQKPE